VDATARTAVSRERALTIATLKSGRYSVARPLELGALLVGASPEQAAALLALGDPLGRAFQLRDDLLGVFGDEATTGKPAGADLVEGKPTLLVAETLTRLSPADAERFRGRLGQAQLSAGEVDELRTLMVDCGARTAVEAHIEREIATARAQIDRLTLAASDRDELHEFATWLVSRSA
jgi:geranylgeranyl diphosphate synthase type I